MRDRTGGTKPGPAGVALLTLLLAASCGGSSGGDQATKFAGPWTFTSGTLTPACLGGLMPPEYKLAGLSVVFMKVDDSTIELTAGTQGCTVTFKVSGDTATAQADSTCTLDLGGALGVQKIDINKWTLKISGDRIDSDLSGAVPLCTAAGKGVLMKGAPDAGAPRPDAGPDGGADKPGDAATESAGETGGDAAAETGGDAAGETGGDAAAETGGDAAAETGGDAAAETGGDAADGGDAPGETAAVDGADGDEAGG